MSQVKRVVLDILKPHHPNVLEFSRMLADLGDYRVNLKVLEMDDKTETLLVEIAGEVLDFELIQQAITAFGASLHSIDEVEVEGGAAPESATNE